MKDELNLCTNNVVVVNAVCNKKVNVFWRDNRSSKKVVKNDVVSATELQLKDI